ncbi:MAG: hypothetical protein IJD48_02395 [Clostridia bacterium]|nr:hypothetical protein [Clostridia bacterium]
MSFYTCNRSGNCPGVISGNPLNGICEKACIQVDKVLDSAMRQIQQTNILVTLENQTPANPTTPLTFVSATTNGETQVNNLVIDRLTEKPNFARVSFDAVVPILVTYTDANGITGTGETTVTIPNDIILFIPQPSIVPYRIEVFGATSSPIGNWVEDNVFNISFCITLITRVLVRSEILVPSYGYCAPPPAQEFTQEVCSGVFELPIFPTAIQNQRI